jgi:malate dehydrogenase (oxaloacetate-decarboxylating)(NADP+)
VLRAVQILREEEIAEPILLGDRDDIQEQASAIGVDLHGVEVIDPRTSEKSVHYRKELAALRRRKGVTAQDAHRLLLRRSYFGPMMVRMGDAQGLVAGLTKAYAESIRPALEIVGLAQGSSRAAGVYLVITKDRVLFFADGSVNIEPTAEELSEIAGLGAATAEWMGFKPSVALLSFSNYGSVRHPTTLRIAEAVRIARERWPNLEIDGEMQADLALDKSKRKQRFPWTELREDANVLIFPDLHSAHIAVRLMGAVGQASVVGPILMGMRNPVNSLQPTASVEDIVNLTAITVLQAQKES